MACDDLTGWWMANPGERLEPHFRAARRPRVPGDGIEPADRRDPPGCAECGHSLNRHADRAVTACSSGEVPQTFLYRGEACPCPGFRVSMVHKDRDVTSCREKEA